MGTILACIVALLALLAIPAILLYDILKFSIWKFMRRGR
jgi:hypothetical protein